MQTQQNPEHTQNKPATVSRKEASTQTEEAVGCQTEPNPQHLLNQSLIELIIGALQIWETTRNKEKRETEIQSLAEHILHSTEVKKT